MIGRRDGVHRLPVPASLAEQLANCR